MQRLPRVPRKHTHRLTLYRKVLRSIDRAARHDRIVRVARLAGLEHAIKAGDELRQNRLVWLLRRPSRAKRWRRLAKAIELREAAERGRA